MGFKKIERKKSRVNTVQNTRGGSLGVKTYVTNARVLCVSSGGGDNDQLQIIFTGVNEPCAN